MQLGIKEGMGIGVMAANGRHFIIGIFAAVGTGAAVMPMSPQLKKAEIDDILQDAKLHAIIDDRTAAQPLDTVYKCRFMNKGSKCNRFINTSKSETE